MKYRIKMYYGWTFIITDVLMIDPALLRLVHLNYLKSLDLDFIIIKLD